MPEQDWGRQDKYWGIKFLSQIVWTRTIQLFRTQFLNGLNNLFFGQSKSYALRRPTSSANFNGDPFADQSVKNEHHFEIPRWAMVQKGALEHTSIRCEIRNPILLY